jgi:hypothetical protein
MAYHFDKEKNWEWYVGVWTMEKAYRNSFIIDEGIISMKRIPT